jgi:DNA-binding IclR family transcriptional regulator
VLQEDRARGFSLIEEVYAPGMNAMAAPVQRRGEDTIGVITIAGPAIRLTAARMQELGAALVNAAGELAMASTASPIFVRQAAARQAAG